MSVSTLFRSPLLQLQPHEQLGKGYLFELKMNQLLTQGENLNPRVAKEFLVGLLEGSRFDSFPESIRVKALKLSEIPAVRMEFKGEDVSVFNPKPHGFDLKQSFRPN